MRTTHTINITIEDGMIIDMDIIQDGHNRTEYILEDVDKPITLDEAINCICEYFE